MNTNKRIDGGVDWGCDNRKLNMDAQDTQDKQDGTLLRKKPTSAMARCGIANARE